MTIPGGRGVALAVQPRAIASAAPAAGWAFEAIMGNKRISWSPGTQPILPLAQCVLEAARGILDAEACSMPKGLHVSVDTSAFFRPEGSKAGLGSSAASAVAIALLICRQAGVDPGSITRLALSIALKGHRAMQGGLGSGYDIYTSMHGGLGIFTGGETPSWKPLLLACLPEASLVFGSQAVSSSGALESFRKLRSQKPHLIEELLRAMSYACDKIEDLCKNTHAESMHPEFVSALMDARNCGIELGRLIGVSALPERAPPHGFIKALGAGNEVAIVIPGLPKDMLFEQSTALVPSGGPLWS